MFIERISKVNRSPANRLDLDEAIFDFLVFALSLLLQDAWMATEHVHRTKIYTATSVVCWLVLGVHGRLLIIMNCVFAILANIVVEDIASPLSGLY